MVALPLANVSWISFLRCPSYASVFTARAWIWELSIIWGVKLFAWMFTVRFPIDAISGSCVARALRSTGMRGGMTGGASYTFAIAMSSLQSISSQCYWSAYCYGSSNSLLLILIGIVLQVYQKSAYTKNLFFYTYFLHTIILTPSYNQFVHTQTPIHSTGVCTTTI
mgnify:CR=1 FL=1